MVSLDLLLALKPRFDLSGLSIPRYISLYRNGSILNDVWSTIYWVMSSAAAIVDANSAECCVLRVRQTQLIHFKMLAEHKEPVLTGSRELCSQQWTVRPPLKRARGLE